MAFTASPRASRRSSMRRSSPAIPPIMRLKTTSRGRSILRAICRPMSHHGQAHALEHQALDVFGEASVQEQADQASGHDGPGR